MPTTNKFVRQPHAVTDLASRRFKALKIERLLGLQHFPLPIRLLEIGCGSGGIAHYFATHPSLQCIVTAVDVHDNRQVHDGYIYHSVQGVQLPFEDQQFDVVISNHVIEHVGDTAAQLVHLQEIRRVLTSTGKAYLAVPNRWMLTEPHYRLKFLSCRMHGVAPIFAGWGKVRCTTANHCKCTNWSACLQPPTCSITTNAWKAGAPPLKLNPTHWSNRCWLAALTLYSNP